MTALAHDPLHAVYDALETAGCDPIGSHYKFTSRCPSHEDSTPSLSVDEGTDGRVLVYCRAGCETRDVVSALGLQWRDLFPPGHYNARPIQTLAKPRAAVDLVLESLRELGINYRCTRNPDMWVAAQCPACRAPADWPLWIQNDKGRVRLSCFSGCEQVAILIALTDTEAPS